MKTGRTLTLFVFALCTSRLAANPAVSEAHASTDGGPKLIVPSEGREYYPLLSRRLGESGRVLLQYNVGVNGRPENVSVVLSDSGSPYLEAAAIRWLENVRIESNDTVSAGPRKTWSLAVVFQLDSCGKLAGRELQANVVVRLCSRRSIWVPQRPAGSKAAPAVERSPELAIQEDMRKAEQGDHEAQRSLCSAHVYWKLTAGEHPEKWCEMAAQVGDPYAKAMLADLYFTGRGVSVDYERAFQLYKDAAVHGLDFAQMVLGAMYVLGRGVDRDPEAGLQWLQRSMETRRQLPGTPQ